MAYLTVNVTRVVWKFVLIVHTYVIAIHLHSIAALFARSAAKRTDKRGGDMEEEKIVTAVTATTVGDW